MLTLALAPLPSQEPKPQPLTLPLDCRGGDCPLLRGTPQTAEMRSGFVRLKPGETVGWHTTGKNEESLVILRGRGEARIDGQPARPFFAQRSFTFLPPHGTTLPIRETSFWSMCTWWRPQKCNKGQLACAFSRFFRVNAAGCRGRKGGVGYKSLPCVVSTSLPCLTPRLRIRSARWLTSELRPRMMMTSRQLW